MKDPALDYWTPEAIWSGQDGCVLASGPSATPEVIESLRGRNLVTVNSTVLSAPWAPVWFFCDTAVVYSRDRGGFEPQISKDGTDMAAFARSFPGQIVTTSRRVKKAIPTVRLVTAERMSAFPPPGSPSLRHGASAGQLALALAIAFGARRAELHGFDMRLVGGVEHHHREYDGRRRDLSIYERKFLPAFAGWNEQARRAGVTVVNATPGSALAEFPMGRLDG